MYLFQSDPRMEFLLRPSSEDLQGLEENIRRLRQLLISPSATGHSYSQPSPAAASLHPSTSSTAAAAPPTSVYSSTTNSPDLLFQYASALVSHVKPSYLHEGVAILENLVFEHWARARRHLEHMNQRRRKMGSYSSSDDESCSPKNDEHENVSGMQQPIDLSKVPIPSGATAPMSDSVAELDVTLEKEQARLDAAEALLPICYYYLAVAWVKLEDNDKARRAVERMLELKPGHPQGESLRAYIDKEQTKDGVVGLAGVALAIAATGLALAGLRRR